MRPIFFSGGGAPAADVVDFGVDVISDILSAVGIDPTGIFGNDSCGTTANYFARNFAVCTKHSAFLTLTDPKRAGEVDEGLNGLCRTHFTPCNERLIGRTSSALNEVCNPQRDRFRQDVQGLVDGLRSMATSHANVHFNVPVPASDLGDCTTSQALQTYLPGCVGALGAQARGLSGQNWSFCGRPEWKLPRPDVLEAACTAAACAPATIKFAACRNYAARAVDTLKLAREANCNSTVIAGPRWAPTFNAHLQFCISAEPKIANFEDAERSRTFFQCRIDAAKPSGIAQLKVAQLPNGDFDLSGDHYPPNARVIIRVSGPAARPQNITSNFSSPIGHFEATLQPGTVCNTAGTITFVAEDQDRPPSTPVNATCTLPSITDNGEQLCTHRGHGVHRNKKRQDPEPGDSVACYSDAGCRFAATLGADPVRGFDPSSAPFALARRKITGIITSSSGLIAEIKKVGGSSREL